MVERRWCLWPFFCKKLIYKSKSKKMEKKELTNLKDNKLSINPIESTPFMHMQVSDKNYLVCGKIKLELNDDMNLQKTTEWLKEKPWDAICLVVEAVTNKTNENKQ